MLLLAVCGGWFAWEFHLDQQARPLLGEWENAEVKPEPPADPNADTFFAVVTLGFGPVMKNLDKALTPDHLKSGWRLDLNADHRITGRNHNHRRWKCRGSEGGWIVLQAEADQFNGTQIDTWYFQPQADGTALWKPNADSTPITLRRPAKPTP